MENDCTDDASSKDYFGYHNPVRSCDTLDERQLPHGRLELVRIKMADSAMYEALIAQPDEKYQQTDTLVAGTPAWFLRHDAGMYERMMEYYVHCGVPAFIGSRALHWTLAGPTILGGANNYLEIADDISRHRGLDREKQIWAGISRGAMHAMAAAAIMPHKYNNQIELTYLDAVAPCFPDQASVRYIMKHIKKLRHELGLVDVALALPQKEQSRYRQTIELSPSGIAYATKTIPSLTDGSMRRIAERIPVGIDAHVHLFEHDALSHLETWKDIFAKFTHMSLTHSEGGHTRILDNDVFVNAMSRIIRKAGANPDSEYIR